MSGMETLPLALVQSMGGLAANIADHSDDELREIRDWCVYLLKKRARKPKERK